MSEDRGQTPTVESIESMAERIGADLQCLENQINSRGVGSPKVRFPRGVLRKASHFRDRFWFLRDDDLQRNVAYALILSDVYRWLLNRTDIYGIPREMVIKECVCLMGSIAESVTKDAMKDACGKNMGFDKRMGKMRQIGVFDKKLEEKLKWLWKYRNREHLFLVKEREHGHYTLKHYNDAIRTMRALQESLDCYFRKMETPF